jgi:hypothetical protein
MSNSKHGHITETPDVSHIKNVDVNHEASDVNVPGIVRFLVGLTVLTVVTFGLMWVLFRAFEKKTTETPRSPMALTEKDRLPPEPRLQGALGFAEDLEKTSSLKKEEATPAHAPEVAPGPQLPKDPLYEIKILRKHWEDVLENGPADQSGKRYGMPIEKAKEEILKQGLPVRKQ